MNLESQPLPSKLLLRVAVVLIVFFAIMAGYYQSRSDVWTSNNRMILEKFNVQTTQELLKKQVEVK